MKASELALFTLLAIVAVLLAYFVWVRSLQCGDFAVRGDAQFFYSIGAIQLDGDGDHKACETLPEPRIL